MQGIPPAKDSDAEDVVWGLQTAEALWKRGERIDAIVWLRRAAQAAGEAAEDDRALELARSAAELSDWLATSAEAPPPAPPDAPPPSGTTEDARPLPPPAPPASQPTMQTSKPAFDVEHADAPDADAPDAPVTRPGGESDGAADAAPPSEPRTTASVPPAEMVHAGMFNPWDEAPPAAPPAPPPPPPTPQFTEDDEVITSVRPAALAQQQRDAEARASVPKATPPPVVIGAPTPAAAKPVPPRPPPLPPRAQAKKPPVPVTPPRVASEPPPPPSEPALDAAAQPAAHSAESPPARTAPPPAAAAAVAPTSLDLDGVDAFADLPDDARVAFARAATLSALAEGEEVSSFALAYVLSGACDVAATMVDAAALRLAGGAVLRTRGTTDEDVPMRLIGVGGGAVVATWSETAVTEAFRTCPWVEDDLRAAADRVLTVVGITIGPLGERLDASIREEIVSRLTLRALTPGELVVKAGDPVPGLMLVGVGELELVNGDAVAGTVGSGEFLFAGEVLNAGAAPATARAGAGGALVMFGGRMVAQELLVTCPPLLEVLAGM